jgi:hypothetical protein
MQINNDTRMCPKRIWEFVSSAKGNHRNGRKKRKKKKKKKKARARMPGTLCDPRRVHVLEPAEGFGVLVDRPLGAEKRLLQGRWEIAKRRRKAQRLPRCRQGNRRLTESTTKKRNVNV